MFFPIPLAKVRTACHRIGSDRVLPARAFGRAPKLGDCTANHNGPGQCDGLDPVDLSLRPGTGGSRALWTTAKPGQAADRAEAGRFVTVWRASSKATSSQSVTHQSIFPFSELCLAELNALGKYSLIVMNAKDQGAGGDSGMAISSTLYGRLMAQYCLNFRTVKLLRKVSGVSFEFLQ